MIARCFKTRQESLHDPLGNGVRLVWVNESEKNKVAEKHRVVVVEALQEAIPVETTCLCAQQMSNIGSIIAFAFHDKGFRPDRFFDGTHEDFESPQIHLASVRKPSVVDRSGAIAGVEDEVDEMDSGGVKDLGEPMGE